MAYYDYQCGKCRKRFTVKQTFAEHDRTAKPKCPKCGSRAVDRLLTDVFVKTAKKS
jgi:putative FmdB family regulatory protein